MASFFDSVKKVAQDVSNKTGDAVETQKLNMKINSEKRSLEGSYTKLGQYFWGKLEASDCDKDEELQAICSEIQASLDIIKDAETEIQAIKDKAEAEKAAAASTPVTPKGSFCANCGASLPADAKFCGGCGAKVG